MKIQFSLVAAAVLLLAASASARADTQLTAVFSSDEVRIIASWYRDQGHEGKHQSKGRGRKGGGLPPGIAKNLARGKALPPGIAKQHLPQGLVSVLPAPPTGFERVVVDGKVLLVEVATQVIHDVLSDLILG